VQGPGPAGKQYFITLKSPEEICINIKTEAAKITFPAYKPAIYFKSVIYK
jgi:hypothetical protein